MEERFYSFQIDLSPDFYHLLHQKAQELAKSEQEILEMAVQSWLSHSFTDRVTPQLALLEKRLEELIDRRITGLRSEFLTSSVGQPSPPVIVPLPLIAPGRPLQSGDLVQVRESGSPYYLAELVITKVGIIRAYVATLGGEQSFLKRDLRLIRAQEDHD